MALVGWNYPDLCSASWNQRKSKRENDDSLDCKNKENPTLTCCSLFFLAYIAFHFIVLPVPIAAKQVVRSPGRRHRLGGSFSPSQQVHDKVWASQIRPAAVSQQRQRPAIHRLRNASVSGKALAGAHSRWTQNCTCPRGILPVVKKPRGQLLPRRPRLHFSCQLLVWAETWRWNSTTTTTKLASKHVSCCSTAPVLTVERDDIQQHGTLPPVGGPLQLGRGEDPDGRGWVL